MKKLRKTAYTNIQKEQLKFIDNISKLLGKTKDMKFKKKYENIIDTLCTVCSSENIKECNDITEKRISQLRNYINNYFRKYISIIANGGGSYIRKAEKIKDVTYKVSTYLQQKIVLENEKIKPFISQKNSNIFSKLGKFIYSADEINNIHLLKNWDIVNVSDRKGDRKGDRDDNIDRKGILTILIYVLLQQLNIFLLKKEKVVAEFIIFIFDMINENREMIDIDYEKINNMIIHQRNQYIKARRDNYEKMVLEKKDPLYRIVDSKYDVEMGVKPNEDMDEFDVGPSEVEYKQRMDAIKSKIPLDKIDDEDFVQSYMEEYEYEQSIKEDTLYQGEKIDNDDVLDDVTDYGDIPDNEDYGQ